MHCHRFECKLCTLLKKFLRVWWPSKKGDKTLKLPFFQLMGKGEAFQNMWSGIGQNKTWSFAMFPSLYERAIFFFHSKPCPHLWTFPCDSATTASLPTLTVHYLPIFAGVVFIFCLYRVALPKGKSSVNVSCRCFNIVFNAHVTFVTSSQIEGFRVAPQPRHGSWNFSGRWWTHSLHFFFLLIFKIYFFFFLFFAIKFSHSEAAPPK